MNSIAYYIAIYFAIILRKISQFEFNDNQNMIAMYFAIILRKISKFEFNDNQNMIFKNLYS